MIRSVLLLLIMSPFSTMASYPAVMTNSTTQANNLVNFLEGVLFQPGGIWPYLFKVYNYGILSITIMMMAFSIMYGAAVMSSDGQGLSRKVNTWLYLRTLGAMALLIPMKHNEFAAIQYLVLKLVWWSVWLSGYAFSGVLFTSVLSTDNPTARMQAMNVQNSYTTMVSMASCALSYAPEGIIYNYSTSPVTESRLRFEWTNTPSGTVAGFEFVGLPQCGRMHSPSTPDARYSVLMNEILNSLRTVAYPIISSAQQIFDANVTAVAPAPGTDWPEKPTTIPDGELSGLCSPYGLGSGSCSTTTTTVDCWRILPISSLFQRYAELVPTPTTVTKVGTTFGSSSVGASGMNIATILTNFNSVAETLLKDTSSSTPPTYTPPNYSSTPSQMNSKVFVNWQIPGTTLGNMTADEAAIVAFAPGTSSSAKIKNGEVLVRQNRARKEIANQVYRYLFNEMRTLYSSGSPNWYTAPSRYSGSTVVKNLIKNAYGGVSIPQTPRSPQWAGVDLHVVPKGIESMIKASLTEITGCNASSCPVSSMTGKGLFGYQASPRSPISYIQDIGLGIGQAAIQYQTNAIQGSGGLLKQDDWVSRYAYAASSVTMATAVAAEAAVSLFPIISWARFANLIIYATAYTLNESYGYMSDLDQYALYKYEPLGSAISSLLLIWGGMFGVFLPAVPFMVTLFAIIGWVFLIIEAMFASPLVALGLTHPNSHQFLGASEQSVMLMMLLVMRPVTILIGIFFAMFLCKNAVFFLNEGIIRFLEAYFSGVITPSGALLFGVLLVYTYTLFVVLVQSFSIIGMLPDKIGSWIGMGPMGGTNPIQQIMGLRQSFEGGAQQASQGASSTGKAKRASHLSETVSMAKMLNEEKGARNARGVMDSFLGTSYGRSAIEGATTKRDFDRLTAGLKGDTKKAAIKLLKSDKLDAREKAAALRTMKGTARGFNHRAVDEYLEKAGVKNFRAVGSSTWENVRSKLDDVEQGTFKDNMDVNQARASVAMDHVGSSLAQGKFVSALGHLIESYYYNSQRGNSDSRQVPDIDQEDINPPEDGDENNH